MTDKSQHTKLTGEENSPTACAGIQTHNLLIMSLVLLPTSYPSSLHLTIEVNGITYPNGLVQLPIVFLFFFFCQNVPFSHLPSFFFSGLNNMPVYICFTHQVGIWLACWRMGMFSCGTRMVRNCKQSAAWFRLWTMSPCHKVGAAFGWTALMVTFLLELAVFDQLIST